MFFYLDKVIELLTRYFLFIGQFNQVHSHGCGRNDCCNGELWRSFGYDTWNKVNDPNKWQPISIDKGANIQQYLTPHWNQVTPFAEYVSGHSTFIAFVTWLRYSFQAESLI